MPNTDETSAASEQFIALLNASRGRLLGFLRTLLGNGADAEDVLQRASLAIWRKFGEFEQSRDFFAWASSFAFYEARNFQHISARSRLHFDEELMNQLAQERVADLDQRDARFAAMDLCIEELDAPGRELHPGVAVRRRWARLTPSHQNGEGAHAGPTRNRTLEFPAKTRVSQTVGAQLHRLYGPVQHLLQSFQGLGYRVPY